MLIYALTLRKQFAVVFSVVEWWHESGMIKSTIVGTTAKKELLNSRKNVCIDQRKSLNYLQVDRCNIKVLLWHRKL